jgi:hypothetical protein
LYNVTSIVLLEKNRISLQFWPPQTMPFIWGFYDKMYEIPSFTFKLF